MADSFFGFDATLPVSRRCSSSQPPVRSVVDADASLRNAKSISISRNLLPHIDVFLQRDDDLGGLGRELSEDEYDALNDETFTHAVRDDWEGSCDSENKIQPLDHWSSISQFVAFQTDTHL